MWWIVVSIINEECFSSYSELRKVHSRMSLPILFYFANYRFEDTCETFHVKVYNLMYIEWLEVGLNVDMKCIL